MPEPDELLRHAGFLRSVVRELLRDEHEVEDVLQETYLAALSRAADRPRTLAAWLTAVARNFARMVCRGGSRRAGHERAAAHLEDAPSTASTVERIEVQQQLLAAVRALEEPYRQVILLRFYDDLAPREIARRLGVPTETVRTRIRRALATLRARLDHLHHGDRQAWWVALAPLGLPPSAAAGGTGLLASGGLVMKTKMAAGAALVCLAATLVLVWQLAGEREAPAERTETARRPVEVPAVVGREASRPAPREPSASPPAPTAASAARTQQGRAEPPPPDRLAEPTGDPSLATLRVLVIDERKVPCAAAAVMLTDYARGKKRVKRQTGADGRVEIRGFAPGEPQLSVRVGALHRITIVELAAGRVTETTVEMPRTGAVVAGTVRHRTKGPLADASVTLIARDDRFSDYLSAKTDEAGRYRIEGAPPGTYRVTVAGKVLGDQSQRCADLQVVGTAPIRRDLELDFEVGFVSLSGVVRDAVTHRPIPGVSVRLQKPVGRECLTDADGAYRLCDVPAGKGKLVVVKEGHELRFVDVGEFVAGETRTLDVALHPAAVLHLYVTDEEGRPVMGKLFLRRVSHRDPSGTSISSSVMTDADGHAVYRMIRPGTYDLSVRQDDLRSPAHKLDIRAGETTVRFQLRPPTPMLEGTVRDATTNLPVAGVRVHAMSLQKTVVTDDRGEFQFMRLTSAEQTLWVSKDGYGFQKVRTRKLEEGKTQSVEIGLGPGATLKLSIKNSKGEPPTEPPVFLLFRPGDAEEKEWSAKVEVDEDGRAVYRCVPPGKYRLIVVSREGSAALEVDVSLAGASVEVRLR
ncbi:MAG: sigma-70 family RNA polymerase sigma factor [Planctomycetota bacterium]